MKKLLALLTIILSLHAVAQTAHSVKLTYAASPSCAITGVTCFNNVYRCQGLCSFPAAPGQSWTPVTTAATPAPVAGPYTDSTIPVTWASVSYYVTAVATGNNWNNTESGASNVWQGTFQPSSPSQVTGTIIAAIAQKVLAKTA